MTWLRHDDDMLDHPKWIRALRDGGADALLVWWRLCAWSSRRLTDGVIPSDMVNEVARVERSKSKARAVQALVACGLCAWRDDGALTIVDYLERNPSKADVLAERDRRAQAQRNRRVGKDVTGYVTGHAPTSDPARDEVPSRPVPSRPVSLSDESEGARAPEVSPPEVPGLVVVYPGPLQPSKRDQARNADPAAGQQPPGLRYRFRPDWAPSVEHGRRAQELGLTREEVFERAEDCLHKPIKHGFHDEDEHFFRELSWLKTDKEKRVFKSAKERDAFENPGRERRAP